MIDFFSSWAEQVVLAVIIATIVELILPNSKNKKYVQMVIGIYILFNIISPIIINKEIFTFEEIDLEKYANNSEFKNTQDTMNERIEEIYLEELEENIKSKFKNKEISIQKCTIDAELDTNKKNAGIHLITIKIKKPVSIELINEIKKEILEEYEITEDKLNIILN